MKAVADLLLQYRLILVIFLHLLFAFLSFLLSFLLRFDMSLPPAEWDRFLKTVPLLLAARMGTFYSYGLYRGMWRYVGIRDVLDILKAVSLSSALFALGMLLFSGHGFPRSVLLMDWMICISLVGGARLAIRVFRESSRRYQGTDGKRAIIVGAGNAGEMLVREIGKSLTLNYEILGFVDDDPAKQKGRIHKIEVLGKIDDLLEICREKKPDEIIIAIPSATGKQMRRVVELCKKTGVAFRTVPSLGDLLSGKANIGQIRRVRLEDLLGREPVQLDVEGIRGEILGKRIIITGAGGSIGSELARQIANFEPAFLILFERSETSLYAIDLELRGTHPDMKIVAVMGDILHQKRVEEVIERYSPDIVYHAAAYKHVPLMEANPLEAVENNIFGTETLALSAMKGGVKKFVFVSSDKAVRPVSIMGMTKKVAENLLLSLQGDPTTFVSVRFGNVIGSSGSVVPLFKKQIAMGGPVTVTDPGASRYFMLPPEAAQLVIQAGAMGRNGQVFFLDMGEPLNILDLAENMIKLSGLEPGRDIDVTFIGLRPGEKLREEICTESEGRLPTGHEKIIQVRNTNFNVEAFKKDLEELRLLTLSRDVQGVIEKLREMAAC